MREDIDGRILIHFTVVAVAIAVAVAAAVAVALAAASPPRAQRRSASAPPLLPSHHCSLVQTACLM